MKRQMMIAMFLLVLLVPFAYSEIRVYNKNSLRSEDAEYIQHSYLNYLIGEGTNWFTLPLIYVGFELDCEGLTAFNSLNPVNQIYNATLYYQYQAVNASGEYSIITGYLGCDDSKDTCDETNTPAYDVEYILILEEGNDLVIDLVTLFKNETSVIELPDNRTGVAGAIDDSFCRYHVWMESINCIGCEDLTYEQMTQELDNKEETFATVSTVYVFISSIIDLNYNLWLFMSWIIKITVMIGAVVFLIYAIFWLYFFIRRLSRGETEVT